MIVGLAIECIILPADVRQLFIILLCLIISSNSISTY